MNEKFKVWLQASRPFAYTASLVPVVLGAALAYSANGQFRWDFLPLVVICGSLFHAGTNFLNDYYDYKKGVDKIDSFGGSRVLPEGKIKPSALWWAGILSFLLGIVLALPIVYVRGWWMAAIGAAGFIGGFFYSLGWLGYKYLGLGDIMVFILMGPLMVMGSYFALSGDMVWRVVLVSLPVGCLVSAILWANNLRDLQHDRNAKVKTLVMFFGFNRAKYGYYFLIAFAYLFTVILVLADMLSLWALLVIFSAPLAWKNMQLVAKTSENDQNKLVGLDGQTAKLHLLFGLFIIIAVLAV